MIAFLLAAALLLDPTPNQTASQKPPSGVETVRDDAANVAILSSVAVTLECTARANGRVEGCKLLVKPLPASGSARPPSR